MPRGDQTGPMGAGALTGRGLGLCGSNTARRAGACLGVGLGGLGLGLACRNGLGRRGRGMMQGSGRDLLEDQKELLEERLKLINDELKGL